MRTRLAIAALALLLPAPTIAQNSAPPAVPDLSYAVPVAGSWSWSGTAGSSEAVFSDSAGRPQLWLRCTRATRRIAVVKPASAAAASLLVWSSSLARHVPATFNATAAQLTAELAANDPLLDALATSRGRIAFGVTGQPALVVPAWAEPVRVMEDCRI